MVNWFTSSLGPLTSLSWTFGQFLQQMLLYEGSMRWNTNMLPTLHTSKLEVPKERTAKSYGLLKILANLQNVIHLFIYILMILITSTCPYEISTILTSGFSPPRLTMSLI